MIKRMIPYPKNKDWESLKNRILREKLISLITKQLLKVKRIVANSSDDSNIFLRLAGKRALGKTNK